jgi:hypothetical protein
MNNIIKLDKFRTAGSKIFTGRDSGEYVREQSRIDYLSEKYDKVIIIIPDALYSINPSFFEEFLVNVVRELGKDNFFEKFEFQNKGDYDHKKSLNEAVDTILREKTALD